MGSGATAPTPANGNAMIRTTRQRILSPTRLASLGAPVLSFVLLAPVSWAAAAEEGADHGADASNNIFAGDVGNILWTLLTLALVIFVLGKYAWGPFLNVLQQREEFIRDSLAQAKEDREAAEERLAEYEERLKEARAEASAIVEEGRRDAVAVRSREEAKAQEEAEKMLQRAKREIQIAKETAIKELYALTGQLATDIASKIVDRELTASDHERLIHDALDQLLESKSGAN